MITEVRIGDDRFQYRDYYDWEGKLLASGDGSLRCLNETTFWNYAPEARLLRIFTPERSLLTLELEPEVDGYWSYNDLLREGVYLRGGDLLMGWYVSQQYSGEPEYFIPSDCSEVIEVEPPTSPEPHYSYYNNSYVRDALTWEGWQFCWTGTAWEGRTEAGERCEIPLPAVVIRPMGELILAFTENATCLLTRDGEIVFCRPFDTGD